MSPSTNFALETWNLNKKLKQTNDAKERPWHVTRVPVSSHEKGLRIRCIVPICGRVWRGDGAVSSLDSARQFHSTCYLKLPQPLPTFN